MKTFKDLEFKQHTLLRDGTQARMKFPDGSDISIITGSTAYCTPGTYEMMSNRTNRADGIRGYMTPKQITNHMRYIQKNPKP